MIKLKAKDIMTRDVLTVNSSWNIQKLACFLVENNISGAPVLNENNELIGAVSMTDIARYKSNIINDKELTQMYGYYTDNLQHNHQSNDITIEQTETELIKKVSDIMMPLVFDVSEEDSIEDVAEVIINHHINRVIVSQGRKPIGIISTIDLLKAYKKLYTKQ